jgi:hypothetical protein
MKVLGLAYETHESGAALLDDGKRRLRRAAPSSACASPE